MPPPVRTSRPRRSPSRRGKFANMPATIRYVLPAVVVAGLVAWGYSTWSDRYTHFAVVDRSGTAVTAGLAEFFVFDESGAARSPSQKIGELAFEGAGALRLGPDLVPRDTLVRVRADGYGVGYCFLRHGVDDGVCELGPAGRMEGVVRGPDGRGIADARVLALGGGAHGVLLVEAVSGSAGKFELTGFSDTVPNLHLRVLVDGFAASSADWWVAGEQERLFELVATVPVTGSVVRAEGVSGALWVQAHALIGVEAPVGEDGRFSIDHLPPPPTRTTLIVGGLPAGFTHRKVVVEPGGWQAEIVIEPAATVAGRVIDDATGLAVAHAAVRHEYGPSGVEVVRCDEYGNFSIGRIPSGEVVLSALVVVEQLDDSGKMRSAWRTGNRELTVEPGARRENIAIAIPR